MMAGAELTGEFCSMIGAPRGRGVGFSAAVFGALFAADAAVKEGLDFVLAELFGIGGVALAVAFHEDGGQVGETALSFSRASEAPVCTDLPCSSHVVLFRCVYAGKWWRPKFFRNLGLRGAVWQD